MYFRKSPWVGGIFAIVLILGVVGEGESNNNRRPRIEPVPEQAGSEHQALLFEVEATDPDNDPLRYSLQGAPAGMTIDPNGIVAWIPGTGATGVYNVTVRVTDALSQTDEEEVRVRIGTN